MDERSDGAPHALTYLDDGADTRAQLVADVRAGLGERPYELPPKYFYDGQGSELFEKITRLPEYYQSRTEAALLERVAGRLVRELVPQTLVELGAGSARKTQILLDALGEAGGGAYVAFDVSDDALRDALERLRHDAPWLATHGVVGDFDRHLDQLPVGEAPRLLALLGGTVGNLDPPGQIRFLSDAAGLLRPDDGLLLGMDLVKGPTVLEAAYDDAAGVTAEFNRNVLRVLNRELGGDFPVEEFVHVARWNGPEERIEMRLRAPRAIQVRLPEADLTVPLDTGEEILTEISCKFTRDSATRRLAQAGLELARWETDDYEQFALAVAQRGRGR
jgi:L-histidine N-alpha-methyltransferase